MPRVPLDCPDGRVVLLGRNINGFGRLQTCDVMQVRVFAQYGYVAQMSFKVKTRCLDTSSRIDVRVRAETTRRVLIDQTAQPYFVDGADGFAQTTLPLTFSVLGGGPFFDIEEDGEANVHVQLTDRHGVSAETRLRVRLQFRRPPDLPDIDPTARPTPTPTATDTPTFTPTPTPIRCTGDCGGDGGVSVDELVRGVRIGLGLESMAECAAFDRDGDRAVAVFEIVEATGHALRGCAE